MVRFCACAQVERARNLRRGFSLLVFAFFYRERDAFFSSERGMMETLPHKNIEEFSKDVVLTKPSSLEELLLAFSYFMPVIAYVSNYFSHN